MDILNPYAEGEWVTPQKNKDSMSLSILSESSIDLEEEEDDLEELPKKDYILRGPIWNYASRRTTDDYYSDLLYGKSKKTLLTEDELLLKGPEWVPLKPVSISLCEYMFRRMKKIDPEMIALLEIETGRSLKYGEVIQKAQSLAYGLRTVGVLPGHVVAVLSYGSLEAYLMILASLLVGAVSAFIDPSLNPLDMGALLRIACPRLIFCEGGKTQLRVEMSLGYLMMRRLPRIVVNTKKSLPRHLINSYFTFHQLTQEVGANFKPIFRHADPKNPVFILFTSGTTSTPKGALIPEQFYMNSRMFLHSTFIIPGSTYTTLLTPPIFWVSVLSSFLIHLTTGHQIVFFRGPASEALIITALYKYKVKLWLSGPATLMYLLSWPAKPREGYPKTIISTGMPFSRDQIIKVQNQVFNGKVHIYQIYGLTEAGALTGNTALANKIGSVGKVFFNVRLKVVEEQTGLVLGPHEVGELCFSSTSMMLGYYNKPDDTEAVFDEEGFLRTGDVGYYDDEGFVFITGRLKELIKWKSYQITPTEVEVQLLNHPAVREAVVFGLPDEKDGEHVAAAVILNPGYEDVDPQILEESANVHLSHCKKIRGGVHIFTKFPSTSSGKPLKRAIARQVLDREYATEETTH